MAAAMRLGELVAGLPVELPAAAAGLEVRGLAHDSRQVQPGDLFVAWTGDRFPGSRFAADAAARGAVAALGEGEAPLGLGVPWLAATAPRSLLAPLASRLYGQPDRLLRLVGITGTNGKSTTTQLVVAMLAAAGRPAGILGTLGYRFGAQDLGSGRTTPEASDFYRVLAAMADAGAEAAVMEVSSHALVQGRVAGATFAVAGFTNLTRDHFDFHRDIEDYFAAKRRLFDQLAPTGWAVLNQEDPYGRRLAAELASRHRVLTYGVGGEVSFAEVELSTSGSRGVISTPRGPLAFSTPLLGRYNLLNTLAAAAVAEALDVPPAAIAEAIRHQEPLPGRLEPIAAGQPFGVYIDYAHTDAALAAAISSLKELSGKRVITVFGCGGDRDPGKRPLMGRVVGELADLAILTSDNPRSEDPLAITAMAEEGLKASGAKGYLVIPDRREAIAKAISLADPESAVLVAGKGHENVQILRDRSVPFSDLTEIRHALEARFGRAATG